MKRHITILFLVIFVASCGQTSTPIPIETPKPTTTFTPEPTATPEPVQLSSLLFLDANGSGLRDNASFICPETNAAPESLEYYFPKVCTTDNIGQLVTVQEPSLQGISVCYKENCAITGTDGTYSFMLSGVTNGELVNLKLTDPNAETPSLALRYINKWNKSVVIPAYSMNDVNIPEQNLNDTKVIPLAQGFSAKVGAENALGLMQGYLTLPLPKGSSFFIWNYFDILGYRIFDDKNTYSTTQDGAALDYTGILKREGNPFSKKAGVGDSHTGLDFEVAINTPVLHSAPNSNVFYLPVMDDGELHVHVMYDLEGSQFEINNAHLNAQLVKLNSKVYRGQIIALSGNTGNNNRIGQSALVNQLHWHIGESLGNNAWKYIDPFRAIISFESEPKNYWGSSVSLWTVDNLPVYSETK